LIGIQPLLAIIVLIGTPPLLATLVLTGTQPFLAILVLIGTPPLIATLIAWFPNCHNIATCHGNTMCTSCAAAVPSVSSFIACKGSIGRDMLRQLRC